MPPPCGRGRAASCPWRTSLPRVTSLDAAPRRATASRDRSPSPAEGLLSGAAVQVLVPDLDHRGGQLQNLVPLPLHQLAALPAGAAGHPLAGRRLPAMHRHGRLPHPPAGGLTLAPAREHARPLRRGRYAGGDGHTEWGWPPSPAPWSMSTRVTPTWAGCSGCPGSAGWRRSSPTRSGQGSSLRTADCSRASVQTAANRSEPTRSAAAARSSWTVRPSFAALSTAGWMYDARATDGVLPSRLEVAWTAAFSGDRAIVLARPVRSAPPSAAAASTVPAQVRNDFALASMPATVWTYLVVALLPPGADSVDADSGGACCACRHHSAFWASMWSIRSCWRRRMRAASRWAMLE